MDTNYIPSIDVGKKMAALEDSFKRVYAAAAQAETKRKLDSMNAERDKHPLTGRPPMQFPATPTQYMVDIDWEWNTPNPPARLECLAYMVNGGGAPKLRGNATATDCVRNSIQAYRDQNHDLAINWLCAGQCHNPQAQESIRQAGIEAAQYAYQKYGASVQ